MRPRGRGGGCSAEADIGQTVMESTPCPGPRGYLHRRGTRCCRRMGPKGSPGRRQTVFCSRRRTSGESSLEAARGRALSGLSGCFSAENAAKLQHQRGQGLHQDAARLQNEPEASRLFEDRGRVGARLHEDEADAAVRHGAQRLEADSRRDDEVDGVDSDVRGHVRQGLVDVGVVPHVRRDLDDAPPLLLEALDDCKRGFGRVGDVANHGPIRGVAPEHVAVRGRLGERLLYGGVEDGRAEAHDRVEAASDVGDVRRYRGVLDHEAAGAFHQRGAVGLDEAVHERLWHLGEVDLCGVRRDLARASRQIVHANGADGGARRGSVREDEFAALCGIARLLPYNPSPSHHLVARDDDAAFA
mmetsp:Transcript_16262/g.54828  ORF Transcript_16262/g.54828 Transcript_16262/m.54828 type:complete len:358 (-) Transcript_16262:331-1404(-)